MHLNLNIFEFRPPPIKTTEANKHRAVNKRVRIWFSSDQTGSPTVIKQKKFSKEMSPSTIVDAREQETSETSWWVSKLYHMKSFSPPPKNYEIKSSLIHSDQKATEKKQKGKTI